MEEDYRKIAQDSIDKAIGRRNGMYSPLGSVNVESVDIYNNFISVSIKCELEGYFIGYAKCNPIDPFKPETGITIAANKALTRSLAHRRRSLAQKDTNPLNEIL